MNWLRRCRVVVVAFGAGLLFMGATLGGTGWYYSGALEDEALVPDRSPEELDLQVAALEGGTIILNTTPEADEDGDWSKAGTFGLEWMGGYGQVGAIREIDNRHVVRDFVPLQGMPVPGDVARLDSFAFPGDPHIAFGMTFEEISVSSRAGDFPAWYTNGSRDTWAIFVHGKGADRREALRMLPVFQALDIPSLVITYRNHDGAPAAADGYYRYGETEWEDLQAAAAYTVDHGARNLVLIGYSMGGGIVMKFLYASQLGGRVVGVILDAPMLDFEATVDWGAREHFVPWPIKDIGKLIAAQRFDIDWDELDYVESARKLAVPILLFHGDSDPKVPVSISDELASTRPDLVTYKRTAGAGHVRSWNADPAGYQAAVTQFLAGVPAVTGAPAHQ